MICFLDAHNADYEEIAKISINGKIEYCKKYNYNFVFYEITEKDHEGRTPHWGKINAIKANLSNCDWLFYCDSDVVLLNNTIKLELYVDNNFNMIVSPLPYEGHIWTSAFLIKNCDWSFNLLNDWYNQTFFINHTYYPDPFCDFKATGINGDGGMYFEQSAIAYLYDTDVMIRNKIKRKPQNDFNCTMFSYHSSPLLIHFPNFSKIEKIRYMKEWAQKNMKKGIKLC